MEMNVSHELRELEARWRIREQEWARKLGRLRLGVEPIEEQLERYRRMTWVLMAVPALIALIIFSLFTVFGRPDIGLVVVAILFGPIVLFSWLSFKKLERQGIDYLAELAQFEAEKRRIQGAVTETARTSEPS
jgi:hypothetical protein